MGTVSMRGKSRQLSAVSYQLSAFSYQSVSMLDHKSVVDPIPFFATSVAI